MKTLVYSPKFYDVIINHKIILGTENSCEYDSHVGGMCRVLTGNYPSIETSLFNVVYTSSKRSIILTGTDKKTTLTENIPPVALDEINNNNYQVVLFSYAEDINWLHSHFKNFSNAIALIDLSGRYKNFNEIIPLLDIVNINFRRTIIFVTEHDVINEKLCQEATKLNIQIIFHTPQEIVYHKEKKSIIIQNRNYKFFGKDFVGYGDYLALMTCQQLLKDLPLDSVFFETCQKLIRMHIDDHS